MKEIWKPIGGYKNIYVISNLGRVRVVKTNLIRKLKIDRYGYPCIDLSKQGKRKWVTVHRLVANAFINNPKKKPQVNHIDGNKQNNYVKNLQWVTNSENQQHASKMGLLREQAGELNSMSKLTSKQVLLIRKLHAAGVLQKELSKKYKVSPSCICNIIKLKTWYHLT